MKKAILYFFLIFSFWSYSYNIVLTDYYGSTYGDFIPQTVDVLDYSNGCFYVIVDLGIVSQGETVSLKVVFPDGSESFYEEECGFNGDALFYKKILFKGLGNYQVEVAFRNETSNASLNVVPDSTEDPFEPNNFANNVFYLERGTILSSLISQNDIDFYTLKVDNPADIEISLESGADLSISVYKSNELIGQVDNDFSGNESYKFFAENGIYTIEVFSPVKETGNYSLSVSGVFPVYLPLSGFDRGFEKKVVVSNLSEKEGYAELHWYDSNGNELSFSNEYFAPFETKEFDGTEYSFLKIYPSAIEINASAYGLNEDGNEAIGYEGRLLEINKTIVSHIATQTNLYETSGYFSFNQPSSLFQYGENTLAENIGANSSLLINFNEIYNNNIEDPWGVAQSDGDMMGIEMFRLIGGEYFQATALTLTPLLARVFYLPHIDVRYFWWTGISIVNPNPMEAEVKLIAFDSDGKNVGEAFFTIAPDGKSVGIVSDYFENGLPENAAAMKIVSSLPVQGLYLFGTKRQDGTSEDIFGGLNSSAIYSRKLYFAVMPEDQTMWTGVGIFNPNNDSISITLKGLDVSGQIISEKTLTLSPFQKYVSLASDIFGNNNVYRMIVLSDKPVCGFYLFGDKAHSYLFGLEAMK